MSLTFECPHPGIQLVEMMGCDAKWATAKSSMPWAVMARGREHWVCECVSTNKEEKTPWKRLLRWSECYGSVTQCRLWSLANQLVTTSLTGAFFELPGIYHHRVVLRFWNGCSLIITHTAICLTTTFLRKIVQYKTGADDGIQILLHHWEL